MKVAITDETNLQKESILSQDEATSNDIKA